MALNCFNYSLFCPVSVFVQSNSLTSSLFNLLPVYRQHETSRLQDREWKAFHFIFWSGRQFMVDKPVAAVSARLQLFVPLCLLHPGYPPGRNIMSRWVTQWRPTCSPITSSFKIHLAKGFQLHWKIQERCRRTYSVSCPLSSNPPMQSNKNLIHFFAFQAAALL